MFVYYLFYVLLYSSFCQVKFSPKFCDLMTFFTFQNCFFYCLISEELIIILLTRYLLIFINYDYYYFIYLDRLIFHNIIPKDPCIYPIFFIKFSSLEDVTIESLKIRQIQGVRQWKINSVTQNCDKHINPLSKIKCWRKKFETDGLVNSIKF